MNIKMYYADDRMFSCLDFVECIILGGPFFDIVNKHPYYEIEFEDETLSQFRFLLQKKMLVPFYYLFAENLSSDNRSVVSTR